MDLPPPEGYVQMDAYKGYEEDDEQCDDMTKTGEKARPVKQHISHDGRSQQQHGTVMSKAEAIDDRGCVYERSPLGEGIE